LYKIKNMTIKINVKDTYAATFLAFLKTVDYVTIEKGIDNEGVVPSNVQEPTMTYGKKKKTPADEIEALIVAKALRDAQAIEEGTLEIRPLEELLTELENG
jgi:phage gp36-like protein